jgi:hypothetical protein
MGSTIERLRKAEKLFGDLSKKNSKSNYDHMHISSEPISQKIDTFNIYEKLNDQLWKSGLAVEQIEQKSLKDLKTALALINACIRKPEVYLELDLKQQPIKDNIEVQIRDILVERKKILLERFSAMINRQKIKQINDILNTLNDKAAKEAIKKNLIQIAIKDQFIQKEYSSIKKRIIIPSP